jgi:NAD(P)-dependent dehydrogenase (short-subunit alcohol dehydrogenase family)/acyl carrier protein
MLGRLWLAGVAIDWGSFSAQHKYRRVPLPTYPFERQRYWIESKGVEKKTAGKKANIADWFYIPTWKSIPLTNISSNNKKSLLPSQDRYLIFVDESQIGEQIIKELSKQGKITAVYSGKQFNQDDNKYAIAPTNPEDYHFLFKAIAESGNIPTKIIYLWSLKNQEIKSLADSQSSIRSSQINNETQDFWSLIYLAQAIPQQLSNNIQLIVTTNNFYDIIGNETLSYDSATVLGALKVIPQEYAYLDCRQVDLDISEFDRSGLSEQLITEFTKDSADKCVAYRNQRRWVQTFEPISLNTQEKSKLKQGGVYLITGGMGGIGLTLAEHLARTVQAKLILLGRSTLPEPKTWDEWLATHNDDDSISLKIQKIKDLEALGAEVLPLSADVCNYDSMNQAIALAVEQFGTINGVIHAAGVAGGGMIQLKTPEVAESVFAPKVRGTLVLHEVLKPIDLDFMVLCSSLTSIVGGFGQADYCAANAFLDAFARTNRQTIAINWDAWQQLGMAVNTEVPPEMKQWQEDNLQHGLLPTEAVEVFDHVVPRLCRDRILNSGLSQVIVSTQDLARAIEENNNFLANYQTKALSTSQQNLSQNYIAPSNEIEKTIAKVWQEVIGFEKIGIHDNFFELGGHSLLAVQVTSRLRETFQLDLPLRTLLFEAPTISQLAVVIGEEVTSKAENQEIEQLLAEIESLSPEELEKELAEKY